MSRHGTSHALATLVCSIAAALLAGVLAEHLPVARTFLDQVAVVIVGVFQLPWSPATVSQLLLAASLAFVWGVGFELMTRRGDRGSP